MALVQEVVWTGCCIDESEAELLNWLFNAVRKRHKYMLGLYQHLGPGVNASVFERKLFKLVEKAYQEVTNVREG